MIKGEKKNRKERKGGKKEGERKREEWTLPEIGKRGNLLLRHLERDEGRIESLRVFVPKAPRRLLLPGCMFSDNRDRYRLDDAQSDTSVLGGRKIMEY